MMQGYENERDDAAKIYDEYHGRPHERTSMCDRYPKCRPVEPTSVDTGTDYRPPPEHYRGAGMQPWDVVDAFGLDYYLGTVIKYVCRAGKKDIATKVDDLRKAADFLHKAIELEQKNEQ